MRRSLGLALVVALVAPAQAAPVARAEREVRALRLAIEDLRETWGRRYARSAEFLDRLRTIENAAGDGGATLAAALAELRREALLANPLLESARLLLVRRAVRGFAGGDRAPRARDLDPLQTRAMMALGLPSNHECNSSLERTGYENDIALLSPVSPEGRLETVLRPEDGGYVGEVDLHWDGERVLFTKSDERNWKIWEMRADGADLRRVSRMPDDVDAFDPCYLPDGRIVFGSTASYQSVPCWHGRRLVSNLYVMGRDGGGVRQLCFDQDHDFHPSILPTGQVLYNRWDYTGICHIFLRQLMVMNPDGSCQRAVYGRSAWYPNSLYFARALPGDGARLIAVLSGYHGVHRMGQLVLIDTNRGSGGTEGLVLRISGRGDAIDPKVRDNLVDADWPKFLHPWPLDDTHFLVAMWPSPQAWWGIYLADVFDNVVLVREEPGYALLEPVLLAPRPLPPAIPDRVDLARDDAVAYVHDVYDGPGLRGVPRGVVKGLRVIAYEFGYRGLAGPDKIGRGGPWEVMRILGTVPLERDGSARFRIPASTPIALQAIDSAGRAVQLMRSWFTAMPGEELSCAGCHDGPERTPRTSRALAALGDPVDIVPWHGAARGFDFAREVQPVLDRHCVSCHDGKDREGGGKRLDLRSEDAVEGYRGLLLSDLGIQRLHPRMREATQGYARYTPAYEALVPYIRRVGVEDDVGMLVPGEYCADTSELVQLLEKGHGDVRLDAEAWDRLVTWIDLNAPCHGTWGEVFPIPDGAHERRMELRAKYGGPREDPENVPDPAPYGPSAAPARSKPAAESSSGLRASEAAGPTDSGAERGDRVQDDASGEARLLDIGRGVTMRLVRIPAGACVIGDARGLPDEAPLARVAFASPFWMGEFEVTNRQYRLFDPSHDPGYYGKRHAREDDQGLPLDGPEQPAVRVSWEEAAAFCEWLSRKTNLQIALPTEAQWEYACRAGALAPSEAEAGGSRLAERANVADLAFSRGLLPNGRQVTGGLEHLVIEGAALADPRLDDAAVVTAPVGSYAANAWGLYDLQGNAAEWTRTAYRPYPYQESDGRNAPGTEERRVVRGGSFFDRPERCRASFRLAYPPWRKVFNVGFRVVCAE